MLKYLFYLLIVYLAYRLYKLFSRQMKKFNEAKQEELKDEMVQDPVCKTYIPRREAFKKTYNGREILFCSKNCADKFEFGKSIS
jgi:YHS domain-containing protein